MDVMKGTLVRINASGKDCIGTSLESLHTKMLTPAPTPRMAPATRGADAAQASNAPDPAAAPCKY